MAILVDYIIDAVRESSDNEDFTSVVGLTEEEILRFINDGQSRLHERIVAQNPNVFIEEEVQTVTSGVEEYTIKSNAFLNNRIVQIDYSYTGDTDDYVPLRPTSLYNRRTGAEGHPTHYIRRADKILLYPTPTTSSGKIRISFTRKIKRLDKRRGQVKASTVASGVVSNLEINYVNGSTVDSTELAKRTKLTCIDKYGNIKMDGMLLSSIDASGSYDATLTIDSSFTAESTETLTVGDYIVSGEYTTTHSELNESIERYIIQYAVWKILKRDSSVDSQEAIQELAEMERGILDSFANLDGDIIEIPNISNDDDWS